MEQSQEKPQRNPEWIFEGIPERILDGFSKGNHVRFNKKSLDDSMK